MSTKFAKQHAYIEGVRDRSLEKLSPAMLEMLWDANRFGGVAPYDAMRLSTRRALNGKGLLIGWRLTSLGRRALLCEWRDANPQNPPTQPADQ